MAKSVLDAIGNTSLVRLERLSPRGGATVLLKLETENPGGSMKDRIGKQIVEDAERDGWLPPGGVVVELTSGNTGIGLAIACAVKGYRMVAVISEGNSPERARMLKAFGAAVELVPQAGGSDPGKVSKEDLELVEQRARELTLELGAFRADQFRNESNPRAHELGTGREIWEQTDGTVTDFVVIVGTGGTFVGVSRALKARNPKIRCHVLEPEGAPFLSGKPVTNTRHKLQGAGYATQSEFWDASLVDSYLTATDDDAVVTARRLAREEGILAGYSTGANVFGAVELAQTLPSDAVVVTVASDTGLRYFSGDLYP